MTAQKATARSRGRPRLPPDQGKRASFTTRIRAELRGRLDREASRVGRSLSEEIEFRLELSVRDQDVLSVDYGGPHNVRLMRVIASAIAAIEARKGARWTEDPQVLQDVHAAIREVSDAFLLVASESTPDLSWSYGERDLRWTALAALVVAEEISPGSDADARAAAAREVLERLLKRGASLDG